MKKLLLTSAVLSGVIHAGVPLPSKETAYKGAACVAAGAAVYCAYNRTVVSLPVEVGTSIADVTASALSKIKDISGSVLLKVKGAVSDADQTVLLDAIQKQCPNVKVLFTTPSANRVFETVCDLGDVFTMSNSAVGLGASTLGLWLAGEKAGRSADRIISKQKPELSAEVDQLLNLNPKMGLCVVAETLRDILLKQDEEPAREENERAEQGKQEDAETRNAVDLQRLEQILTQLSSKSLEQVDADVAVPEPEMSLNRIYTYLQDLYEGIKREHYEVDEKNMNTIDFVMHALESLSHQRDEDNEFADEMPAILPFNSEELYTSFVEVLGLGDGARKLTHSESELMTTLIQILHNENMLTVGEQDILLTRLQNAPKEPDYRRLLEDIGELWFWQDAADALPFVWTDQKIDQFINDLRRVKRSEGVPSPVEDGRIADLQGRIAELTERLESVRREGEAGVRENRELQASLNKILEFLRNNVEYKAQHAKIKDSGKPAFLELLKELGISKDASPQASPQKGRGESLSSSVGSFTPPPATPRGQNLGGSGKK